MQSERENIYILVAHHYDENIILPTQLKNRIWPRILNGITKNHEKLRKRVFIINLHITENEVSEDLIQYFEESYIQFQLVPPQIHRRNSDKWSFRTFKNPFMYFLFTVAPVFPLYLWDHLLPQVSTTINMLRIPQLNPGLSAYEQVDSIQKFERTQLAPLGCKVQIYEKIISDPPTLPT